MNSYGQNPLCRKSREIRNYCFSFNYALLKVIVAFSFNYAFLRTIVVFTDCIKLVVLFHDTKRRPKGLLFRITDVEQDTGREPERAGALGESPVDSRVATGSSRLREAAQNGRFAQRICVSPVSSAKPKNPQRYAAGFVLGFKDCRIIKESHPDVNKDY